MKDSLAARAFLSVLMACAVAPNCSRAALLVYEGFDYADGTSIRTQTGGVGWSDAWTNTGNATEIATTPGMTYSGLAVQGKKVTLTAQQTTGNGNNAFVVRNTTSTFGTDGTTLWVSLLGQRTGTKSGTAGPGGTPTYHRVYGLAFFNTATEQFSIGELSNDSADVWNLNPDATVANSLHTTTAIDAQAFLLLKITYGAGDVDSASLWVNPNLALGEAGLGAAQATIATDNLTFNRLRLTAGGSQTGGILAASGLLDEIRVGDTFGDVAPVPEPISTALVALGASGMAIVRRRRRPR